MSAIKDLALRKAAEEDLDLIDDLWKAFVEKYEAFDRGEMPLDDEVKYQVLSSPGPRQYQAFSEFFGVLKKGREQILGLKEDMHMHDFADIVDGTSEPIMLDILKELYKAGGYDPKKITWVSGLFWGQHVETREKIIQHLEKIKDVKKCKIRILTRAEKEDIVKDRPSLFVDDSQFNMTKRIPFHYMRVDNKYLYFEFPHTESSVFRLSMLLDLDKLDYENSKTDMLQFLDSLIEKANVI